MRSNNMPSMKDYAPRLRQLKRKAQLMESLKEIGISIVLAVVVYWFLLVILCI